MKPNMKLIQTQYRAKNWLIANLQAEDAMVAAQTNEEVEEEVITEWDESFGEEEV